MFESFRAWLKERKEKRIHKMKIDRGQIPCPFAHTPDGLCPNYIERRGSYLHNVNVVKCCQVRMNKAKMDFALLHDNVSGAECAPGLKPQLEAGLKRYKENYPEEYAYVFGENEEYRYTGHFH